jgi:hypothetical protein
MTSILEKNIKIGSKFFSLLLHHMIILGIIKVIVLRKKILKI